MILSVLRRPSSPTYVNDLSGLTTCPPLHRLFTMSQERDNILFPQPYQPSPQILESKECVGNWREKVMPHSNSQVSRPTTSLTRVRTEFPQVNFGTFPSFMVFPGSVHPAAGIDRYCIMGPVVQGFPRKPGTFGNKGRPHNPITKLHS